MFEVVLLIWRFSTIFWLWLTSDLLLHYFQTTKDAQFLLIVYKHRNQNIREQALYIDIIKINRNEAFPPENKMNDYTLPEGPAPMYPGVLLTHHNMFVFCRLETYQINFEMLCYKFSRLFLLMLSLNSRSNRSVRSVSFACEKAWMMSTAASEDTPRSKKVEK